MNKQQTTTRERNPTGNMHIFLLLSEKSKTQVLKMKRVMDNADPVDFKRFEFGPQGGDKQRPAVSSNKKKSHNPNIDLNISRFYVIYLISICNAKALNAICMQTKSQYVFQKIHLHVVVASVLGFYYRPFHQHHY